jgi:hypothetical protein
VWREREREVLEKDVVFFGFLVFWEILLVGKNSNLFYAILNGICYDIWSFSV